MGPGVKKIAEKYEADYALFSYYRDYQASGGRVALSVLSAVIGVGVAAGSESGYASLIDLQTGDIVWFNQLVAGKGELRNKDEARQQNIAVKRVSGENLQVFVDEARQGFQEHVSGGRAQ